jgi:hypothetical protein
MKLRALQHLLPSPPLLLTSSPWGHPTHQSPVLASCINQTHGVCLDLIVASSSSLSSSPPLLPTPTRNCHCHCHCYCCFRVSLIRHWLLSTIMLSPPATIVFALLASLTPFSHPSSSSLILLLYSFQSSHVCFKTAKRLWSHMCDHLKIELPENVVSRSILFRF